MRVLVTGASGFIGRRICRRLLENQYQVVATGRSPKISFEGPLQYIPANLTDSESCARATRDIDSVIHCAGLAGTWGPHSDYYKANVVSTETLIEACQKNGVSRLVNISSPSIYFDYEDQLNLKEDQIPRTFSNSYASTKWEAEKAVTAANSQSLSTISLRPRGVIGAGDKNWLPRIIKMRRENRLVQPGPGKNLVDFTSVENLLDAIELCLATTSDNCGEVYNVTDGQPELFWDFVERALERVGLDGKRKNVPLSLAMGLGHLSEKFHKWVGSTTEPPLLPLKIGVAAYSMTLDISKAKKRLGYQPRVSTDWALDEFSGWWRAQEKKKTVIDFCHWPVATQLVAVPPTASSIFWVRVFVSNWPFTR